MLKWLLVIGVIALIYYVFIKKKPAIKKDDSTKSKAQEEEKPNEMVECSNCGVYCELDDAIISNGKYYCCDECLKG